MARLQEKLKTMMKDIPQDEMVRRAKIDELLHEEADSLFVNYCPHKIVDALLYHKSLIMKSHGIDYSIVAAVPAELNLDGYAILSVLSNLIDNAIEAVLALDKDRVIDIHLHTRANVLVCQVENTIPAHAALVKGRSTKKDQNSTASAWRSSSTHAKPTMDCLHTKPMEPGAAARPRCAKTTGEGGRYATLVRRRAGLSIRASRYLFYRLSQRQASGPRVWDFVDAACIRLVSDWFLDWRIDLFIKK